MVTNDRFDLHEPHIASPIAELNEEIAGLKIAPPTQDANANGLYGENVFGVRFNGGSALAERVDAVSRALWPTDVAAVDRSTATLRDYLLVCANYPDADRTDALQYFATFQPDTSPWIQDEEVGSPLRNIAENAVNIDSSVKLKEDELPPNYIAPLSAYPMNLFWLTQTMNYPMAVLEINRAMKLSLKRSGLELGRIEGAKPRTIGDRDYTRFIIDPSTERNSALVEATKSIRPNIFHLTNDGVINLDSNSAADAVTA